MLKTHKDKGVSLEGNEQNMDSKLKNVNKILKKYKQEHLLQFFNEIDDKEKQENLLDEILNLNFSKMLILYKNSMTNNTNYKVTPIDHVEKNNLSVEDIADELEMTPSMLQQKMQSMDYSFLNAVNDCCKKMVEAEKRSLKNEHK